jgi:hypothetical protein
MDGTSEPKANPGANGAAKSEQRSGAEGGLRVGWAGGSN